jgi:hypothetical protein
MSVHVMVAIFDADGLTSTEKLVALAYAEHGHDDGTEARAGIARICSFTALSRRTVQSTLHSLVSKGVLVVDREATYNRPTCYRFLLAPDNKSLAMSGGADAAPHDSGGAIDDIGGATDDAKGRNSRTRTVSEPPEEPSTLLVVPTDDRPTRFDAQFAQLWDLYPRKRGKADAEKMVRARLRAKVAFEDLLTATENYAKARIGENPDFTVWPKRFYGPDYWRDFLPGGAALIEKPKARSRDELELDIDNALVLVQEVFVDPPDVPRRTTDNTLVERLFENFTRIALGRMNEREIRAILAGYTYERTSP